MASAAVRRRVFSSGPGGDTRDETTSLLSHSSGATEHEKDVAFDALRERVAKPFESDKPGHIHLLQELWRDAFPEKTFELPSEAWSDLGFQGKDPRSDFRGGGVLSLKLLKAFVRQRGFEAEAPTSAASAAFPLALASINVTGMLMAHLQLRPGLRLAFVPAEGSVECSPEARQAFLGFGWEEALSGRLLSEGGLEEAAVESGSSGELAPVLGRLEGALAALHDAVLLQLIARWRRMQAADPNTNLLSFPTALRDTFARLARATRAGGANATLEEWLYSIDHATRGGGGLADGGLAMQACECVVRPAAYALTGALSIAVGVLLGLCNPRWYATADETEETEAGVAAPRGRAKAL